MKPLTEDTLADKALRFAIGGVLGALTAWYLAARTSPGSVGEVIVLISVCGAVVGLLAVLFGNRFLERFIRDRWWE